jgi:hypothetical protein
LPESRRGNAESQDGGHEAGAKHCNGHRVLLIEHRLARSFQLVAPTCFSTPAFTTVARLRLAQISAAARTRLDLNEGACLLIYTGHSGLIAGFIAD